MKGQTNVDTTQTTSCLEWCAGYGGISLGLKRAIPSLRTIAFGEIEAFACANLVAKMEAGLLDPAPIWTDIKTFPCEEFRDKVDILVAGYPCQPFSSAGKRLGTEDPRHLWPHIQRSISIIRPRLCFFENVEGHISLGLSTVISDLEELGYKVSWGIFSASEVGAPHQRKRVFILADSSSARHSTNTGSICRGQGEAWRQDVLESQHCSAVAWPSRPGEPQYGWEPPRVVVDAKSQRAGQRSELCGEERGSRGALPRDIERPGEKRAMGNATELFSDGGTDNAGISKRSEEISESGNASWAAMGNADHGRLASGLNSRSGAEADRRGEGDIEQAESGQIESNVGLHIDESPFGVGHSELSSLCDSELAEIREWMVKCDNRTDELRLLGNGVVPATAARAFVTLLQELTK